MNSQNLKASVSFVGDGSTKKFYFGFDYLNKQFVKVQIGTEGQSLSYPSDYTVEDRNVILTEAPAVGVAIRVYRETSSDRMIEWADGAFIKASQMTLENLQQLHLIEEAQDYPILNSLSKYPDGVHFNALGSRVINVGDPQDEQDVVTKHYMENVQGGFVASNTNLVSEATKQASAAKTSQEAAKSSQTAAKTSETNAETSNQNAKKWAVSTTSPDNQADTDSTTGKTQSSRSWALYSKTKAQEAATSACTAKTQADTAATQANNAKTSATNSANSASASATSASNAKTSETNAKASETQAGTYANNAKASASASATSATNAHNSETAAANSAKQAADSAGVFQDFKGATSSADGLGGKVPKPLAGQQERYLKANGTWSDVPKVTPNTLWSAIHSYGNNYVPSDTSNTGWNKLGFASISYSENKINQQPTRYGQLINFPFDQGVESTQLWLDQDSGRIRFRGGNGGDVVNNIAFKCVATTDEVNEREKVNSQGSNWIRYESGLQICWTEWVGSNSWWSFPVAFSGTPAVTVTARSGNWQWIDGLSNTGFTNKGSGGACAIAVGRWK